MPHLFKCKRCGITYCVSFESEIGDFCSECKREILAMEAESCNSKSEKKSG